MALPTSTTSIPTRCRSAGARPTIPPPRGALPSQWHSRRRLSGEESRLSLRPTAAEGVPPLLRAVARRRGGGEEVPDERNEAGAVGEVGEVAGALEQLEPATRHREVGDARLTGRDHRIARAPHE